MNSLWERILVWILVVVFAKLKKKYPTGLISQFAIIDVEELDQTIKEKLDLLTPEEAKNEVIQTVKGDCQALIDKIKAKLEEVKNKKEGK